MTRSGASRRATASAADAVGAWKGSNSAVQRELLDEFAAKIFVVIGNQDLANLRHGCSYYLRRKLGGQGDQSHVPTQAKLEPGRRRGLTDVVKAKANKPFPQAKVAPAKISRIVVTARLKFFGTNKTQGWLHAGGTVLTCAIGAASIIHRKREGDHATPAGRVRLADSFF